MVIEKQILKLRNREGLTQEQLAEEFGISRQAVAKWESGENIPDIYKIVQLSERFHVTLDYLVYGKNRKMTDDDIEVFIKIMEELGDYWLPDQVVEVYGDKTLGEALTDRYDNVKEMITMIRDVICRESNNGKVTEARG